MFYIPVQVPGEPELKSQKCPTGQMLQVIQPERH